MDRSSERPPRPSLGSVCATAGGSTDAACADCLEDGRSRYNGGMHRRTFLAGLAVLSAPPRSNEPARAEGYQGIWYFNQPTGDQHRYKYSGGFATYPQQHAPIAIYAPEVRKTFFCFGGVLGGRQELLHCVSYYDHRRHSVPRPVILLNKQTEDAHDNPVLSIDAEGHLWVFSNSHGQSRPSFIHRSRRPWSVDSFERVLETNFSYGQPWHLSGRGFLFLHTRYSSATGMGTETGRALYQMTSADGRTWSGLRELAFALRGHYQISWPLGGKVGTAFNVHPPPLGLNQRTNLYYMETPDGGATWRTASGEPAALPVRSPEHETLVRDFRREGLLVYLKDLQFDPHGRPAIVHLTCRGFEPGPESGLRHLMLARWTGQKWRFSQICSVDHNYDHGSLYIEDDGRLWRFLGPTGAGPQPWAAGGEIEEWVSRDSGQTWSKSRELTRGSRFNHTYLRRPLHAHPEFCALWADGNPLEPSPSSLYFANRSGDVFRLPFAMRREEEEPERVRI